MARMSEWPEGQILQTVMVHRRDFAERNNWLPRVDESEIYDFDEIPRLVADYAAGQTSYYPIYRVNAS